MLDLSIIITAHSEGLIAHKTMLSILEAAKKLPASVQYEVIISIDNGDVATKSYFNRYGNDDSIKVIHLNYKDLSASRNHAVSESRGKYVSFLDADDLISENWLRDSFLLLKASEQDVVYHPEYSITFGDDNLLWHKRDSHELAFDTLCLVDNNLWDSPCIAKKSVFMRHPYFKNGDGFGYEDKHFNSETLAAGIPHRVVPGTVLFVRRKYTGSMLRQASADLVTLAPTSLLSYEAIRNLNLTPYISGLSGMGTRGKRPSQLKVATRVFASKAHGRLKKYGKYNQLTRPLHEQRRKQIERQIEAKYPKWLISTWKQTHHIDNSIFPSRDLLRHLNQYDSDRPKPGIAYARIIQSFRKDPDTLFFVPHLIKGGADLLFINYSAELATQHPEWNIAVLQTEARESVWRDKLSEGVDFVNIFELMSELDEDTQRRILATIASQLKIKRIIIGNSQLAYDFISKYQSLIRNLGITIYCFAFGEEFDDEGRLWGHIHTGIPRIYPVIHRIITDNTNTVNKLEAEYGFDRKRFAVHYQPTAATITRFNHQPKDHIKVLWASRVCKQKRPDILKRVSNILDSSRFSIDAYGQLEEGLEPSFFNDSRVIYKGAYNGLSSIPTKEYDIYLYTSEGDGIPNVLQEVTAAGLPIVASNVGGIREFVITNKTGFLVENHEDIEAYVNAITELSDAGLRQRLNNGAQKLLKTQFSHDSWKRCLQRDFDQ